MNGDHVFIIAEAGVNHNGSLDMAMDLVEAAHEACADAVKFQTFSAASIASANAAKAGYQLQTTDAGESQLDMLRRLELSPTEHKALYERCRKLGLEFMSTPFDLDSVDVLTGLGVSRLKVPSGEITNGPLLLKVARTGLPLIVSTGMATLGEVEACLGALAYGMLDAADAPGVEAFARVFASEEGGRLLRERVTLLHCTTEYPAPLDEVNLRAMGTLSSAFGLPVGYSDHTEGISVAVAAAARGARIIEKHFTLDKTLPGPDHKASLEPRELATMVRSVRAVESALGHGRKVPGPAEVGNRAVARKSLVAARPIAKGEIFSKENMTVKRPGTGVSPMLLWDWLGRPADRNYETDEVIES
ncbi:MAG: N-acetylneuraminate synthase [Desulfovibrionaceae bacterium]